MKKRNIIIITTVLAALIIIVGVFAFLNAGSIGEKKMLEKNEIIIIKSVGIKLGQIDMDLIDSLGPKEFAANLDTSDSESQEHKYTGILLNDTLKALDINIKEYSTVIIRAIDGYTVAFTSSEVLEEDNIYIAIMRDGKPLGSKSSGGSGPYQAISRKDAFSQRWCKFIVELELK